MSLINNPIKDNGLSRTRLLFRSDSVSQEGGRAFAAENTVINDFSIWKMYYL